MQSLSSFKGSGSRSLMEEAAAETLQPKAIMQPQKFNLEAPKSTQPDGHRP